MVFSSFLTDLVSRSWVYKASGPCPCLAPLLCPRLGHWGGNAFLWGGGDILSCPQEFPGASSQRCWGHPPEGSSCIHHS